MPVKNRGREVRGDTDRTGVFFSEVSEVAPQVCVNLQKLYERL